MGLDGRAREEKGRTSGTTMSSPLRKAKEKGKGKGKGKSKKKKGGGKKGGWQQDDGWNAGWGNDSC